MTAIGVCGDNASIPLAGYVSFVIPTGGAPALANWIAPDFEVELSSDAVNSHRPTWRFVGITGDLEMRKPALSGSYTTRGARIRIWEGPNAMQGGAVLDGAGNAVVVNTLATLTARIMHSIQLGPPPTGLAWQL